MQVRTIEDLHDKHIGHKKFAKIVDILEADGYPVKNIREFNEKFKFTIDKEIFEYSKDWKASAYEIEQYIINILKMKKSLK